MRFSILPTVQHESRGFGDSKTFVNGGVTRKKEQIKIMIFLEKKLGDFLFVIIVMIVIFKAESFVF